MSVRISKMREYWYIFVPKPARLWLESYGVKEGDTVIWKDIRKVDDKRVEVTLEIIKN